MKPFLDQPCQLQSCSAVHIPHQTFSARTCSIKVSMAEHNEPNEVKTQIRIMSEKLRETLPISVKEFPWSKAERKLVDRLIPLARKALNWSLVLFFVFSSISDIVYTFSINRELIIPIGLFVGCLTADFLKETSQELFHSPEVYLTLNAILLVAWLLYQLQSIYVIAFAMEVAPGQENGLKQHVLGMYCFFVFVKMISACFGVQARVFLLHVANGGLMQALWYWRSSREDVKNGEEGSCSSGLEAS